MLLLPAPAATAASAATYYVSPAGDDRNDGRTPATPLRTIQRCANIAQPGDTCTIRAGVYREAVRPARSGAAGQPITFAAYAGESAIVMGTDPITGWSLHAGAIYTAPMPWDMTERVSWPEPRAVSNQLFAPGLVAPGDPPPPPGPTGALALLPEARWPNVPTWQLTLLSNADEAQADAAAVADPHNATYYDADLAGVPAGAFDGAKITFAPGIKLLHTTCDVVSQSAGAVSFRCNPDPAAWDNAARLDPPGTMLGPSANNYYYLWGALAALDAPGEWYRDPASGMLYLRAPRDAGPPSGVEARRRLWGFDLGGRQHILLDGLAFFAASIRYDAATSDTTVQDADFRYPWHTQELPPPYWANGTHALQVMGSRNVVRDSDLAGAPGCMIMLGGRQNRAVNNVIRAAGYMGISSAIAGQLPPDANPGGALRNEASHNTLFDLGRIAFFADAGLDITYNDVYNSHLQTSGLGAIFAASMDGKGAAIAYNLVHDIRAERTAQYNGGFGIFLDDNTYGYKVYRNTIWNTTSPGLFVYGTNGALPAARPPGAPSERQVFNNTVVDGRLQVVAKTNTQPPQTLAGTEVRNNIAAIADLDDPALTAADHNYQGDPVYVDAAGHDYRLRPGSPAVDAGVHLGSPFMDAPMAPSGAPDLGALESGRPPLPIGAVLRRRDLAGLHVSCAQTGASTARCTLANLPIGRSAPADLQLRIGVAGAPAGACLTRMDYASHVGTATCEPISTGGQAGVQPVSVRIGAGAWQPAGSVDLGPLTIHSVQPPYGDPAGGTRLTLLGRRFASGPAGYGVALTLSNQSGAPLYNYPVLVRVDTATPIAAGKLRSDCGDLRFYDADGSLAYWLEGGCNTAQTRLWVRVPVVPAQTSEVSETSEVSAGSIITLTYGNATLLSQSDGRAVFPFFDDFEDGVADPNIWTLTPGRNATVQETAGQMRLAGPLSPSQPAETARFMLQFINDTLRFPPAFALDSELSILAGGRGFVASAGGCHDVLQLRNAAAHLPPATDIAYYSAGWHTLGQSSVSAATFAGLRVSVGYAGPPAAGDVYWIENGALAAPRAVRRGVADPCRGSFSYLSAGSAPFDVRFDNIRLRPFAFPEPAVAAGAEAPLGVRVLVGDQPCRDLVVESPTRLVCTAPAETPKVSQTFGVFPLDVSVVNPDGARYTLPAGFRYGPGWRVALPLILN